MFRIVICGQVDAWHLQVEDCTMSFALRCPETPAVLFDDSAAK
jgi:hypothetical protein